MSTIANPNWLAITAAFFIVTGIALLARAAIINMLDASSEDERLLAAGRRTLNTYLGAATLALGAFMHMASHMTAPPLNFMLVVFTLSLAFGLLVYAFMEDLWAERLVVAKEQPKRPAPRLHLIAPPAASEPRELKEAVAVPTIEATALP